MKKFYILAMALAAFAFNANAQIEYEENFDALNLGDMSPQSFQWRTWSGTPGGAEEAQVVNSQAFSGAQSLEINEVGAPAGIDMVMLIDAIPSSGVYTVQWYMFVPDGREGYFNAQGALTPAGNPWNQALFGGNVYFNENGADPGVGRVDGTPGQNFTFPHDEWFKLTLVYDMDIELWSMYINDELQFDSQSFEFNDPFVEFAGIDFYAPSAATLYYVDDVLVYNGDLTLGINELDNTAFSVYPNPVRDILNISSTSAVESVVVYDVLGKVVLEYRPDRISPSIDMSALNSGAYLLRVTIDGVSKTVKVIK